MTSGNPDTEDQIRFDEPLDAVAMANMIDKPNGGDQEDTGASGSRPQEEARSGADDRLPIETRTDKVEEANTTDRDKGKGREDEISAAQRNTAQTSEPINTMGIGAAVDEIKNQPSDADSGPVCNITLLLTTGSRHPYKIDARYLSKRNVPIPDQTGDGQPDPFSISIYTLKELILREWRNDWEAKPASPTSIRLIHFGKLLDDKEQLKRYHFSPENPNVVHMSIRPSDLDEEDPRSGSKHLTGNGSDNNRSRRSGCCVIL